MSRIVIDSGISYARGVLEPYAEVIYKNGNSITAADVRDADAMIIRTRTRCNASLLESSGVGMIATATIGYDHIDTDYCAAKGINVATAAGSNARGVLQWVAAALSYAAEQQNWHPSDKTIGVVGVGNVGSLVASYCGIWGFNVLCCDPPRKNKGEKAPDGRDFIPFEDLIPQCGIVTFHTPLSHGGEYPTHHMVSGNILKKLPIDALLLNSSRGEVVDTHALKEVVAQGRCAAIIDTWENEPDIDPELLELCMLGTPHIAGYSAQGKAKAASMAVQAVAGFLGIEQLRSWYPRDVSVSAPRRITWRQLGESITDYFDIAGESRRLKERPQDFESFRTGYKNRQEYF